MNTLQPFQPVLVRNTKLSTWKASLFCHYSNTDAQPFVTINNIHWQYCIPYEGNETLHGTKLDYEQ